MVVAKIRRTILGLSREALVTAKQCSLPVNAWIESCGKLIISRMLKRGKGGS